MYSHECFYFAKIFDFLGSIFCALIAKKLGTHPYPPIHLVQDHCWHPLDFRGRGVLRERGNWITFCRRNVLKAAYVCAKQDLYRSEQVWSKVRCQVIKFGVNLQVVQHATYENCSLTNSYSLFQHHKNYFFYYLMIGVTREEDAPWHVTFFLGGGVKVSSLSAANNIHIPAPNSRIVTEITSFL